MIYLLIGNKKERKKFVRSICDKNNFNYANVQHFYIDDFKENNFEEIIPFNIGLFEEKEYFVFHSVIRELEIKKILKDYFQTEHFLFFSEKTVLKKDLNSFEKIGVEIIQFDNEIKKEERKFNIFRLADLLGSRDKKNLWLVFREAIKHASLEEIHGILFWQLKNLALVKNTKTNPGLNTHVYIKNKSFSKNFSMDEIKYLSNRMVEIFHNRSIYHTLEIDLEKFILDL